MPDSLGFLESRDAALAATCDVVLRAANATVWVLDADFVCRFSSGVVPLLGGRSHEDVIGLSAVEYLGAERAAKRLPLLRRALAGEVLTFTTSRAGQGEYDVYLAPLVLAGGKPAGVVAVMSDVTERNHALREREARLDLLLGQLPAFVWTTDTELRIVELLGEAARAEHLTPIGTTLREFWAEGDSIGAVAAHERALAGESVTDESTYMGRTLRSQLEPLRNVDGAIVGVIGVASDVTAERELQLRLAQAQKLDAVGRLTGGIAHDFNNMLTVIAGYTEVARSRPDDIPAALDAIDAAARSSATLIRQLLAFGRQQTLESRVVDLNDIVSRMLALLSRLLGERITIVQSLARDRPCVSADPSQIEQVIANLAINARDAMQEGGTLTIETRVVDTEHPLAAVGGELPAGRYAVVVVADTGAGMRPEILERVFDPFFSTKAPGQGTGLGLATVFGIVGQSGGGVVVRSEVGVGTTFEVYLPAVAPRGEPAVAEQPVAPGDARYTILLVDDVLPVQRVVSILLERAGHTVHAVSTPVEALDLLARDRFDVLVTDLQLPELNGFELIAQARARGIAPRAVVVTSGWGGAQALHHADGEQDFVFLRKPFDADELAAAIAAAAAQAAGRN